VNAVTNDELVRTMDRIERKLDMITTDHESRLRRIERAVWVMTGVGGVGITSGVGALLQGVLGG
jgi:hypothetical protein